MDIKYISDHPTWNKLAKKHDDIKYKLLKYEMPADERKKLQKEFHITINNLEKLERYLANKGYFE